MVRFCCFIVLGLLVALATLALMTVEDQAFEDIAFEAVSAFGTPQT